MDASRAKARSTRKSRPSEGGRGAKAARPVHPAKGMSGTCAARGQGARGTAANSRERHAAVARRGDGSARLPEVEVEVEPRRKRLRARARTPARARRAKPCRGGRDGGADDSRGGSSEEEEEAEDEATVERKRGRRRAGELPRDVLPRHGGARRPAARAGVRNGAQHRADGAGPLARRWSGSRPGPAGFSTSSSASSASRCRRRSCTARLPSAPAASRRFRRGAASRSGSAARDQAAAARHRPHLHRCGA